MKGMKLMTAKFILYILVAIVVIWSLDGVNINSIFKKNRVMEARIIYFFIAISLTYLVTNFFYDLYINFALR